MVGVRRLGAVWLIVLLDASVGHVILCKTVAIYCRIIGFNVIFVDGVNENHAV